MVRIHVIADRPVRSVKAKIRALTQRVSQADMGAVIGRINQILRGWTNYFRHAVCKHTLSNLKHFADWRVIRAARRRWPVHRWKGRPAREGLPLLQLAAAKYRPRRRLPTRPARPPGGSKTLKARSPNSSTTGRRRRVGLSDAGPETQSGAARAMHPISDAQIKYSLFSRRPERAIVEVPKARHRRDRLWGAHPRAAARRLRRVTRARSGRLMFKGDHPAVGQAFRRAGEPAREFGRARVGSEHLLLALTGAPDRAHRDRKAVRQAAPDGAGVAADHEALTVLGIDLGPLPAGLADWPPAKWPLFPLGAGKARRRCAGASHRSAWTSKRRTPRHCGSPSPAGNAAPRRTRRLGARRARSRCRLGDAYRRRRPPGPVGRDSRPGGPSAAALALARSRRH